MSLNFRRRKETLVFAQRQPEYCAGGLHTWESFDGLQKLLNEHWPLRAGVAVGGHIQQKSEYMIGAEARIDMLQAIEAAQEQAGSGKQNKCDGQLGRHQDAAKPGATWPAAGTSRAVVKDSARAGTGGLQSRCQPEEDASRKRDDKRENQHAPIKTDVGCARQSLRSCRDESARCPTSEQKT